MFKMNKKIKGSKNLNVPNLRFPEFSGEWEKSRLNRFASKITKKNKGNTISNVLSNSANYGIIPQIDFFDRSIANSDNTEGYYVIEKNDFVYNPRKSASAPYGPINVYNGEACGIISPLYLCFKVKGINRRFLYHYFKSTKWHPYMYANGDSGARHDRVSIKDETFLELPIFHPGEAEQCKIVELVESLDNRIATQIKIIEKLESLIKGLCSSLFDKNKYDSFVRLGDISEITNGNSDVQDASLSYSDGMYPFFDRSEDIKFLPEYLLDKEAIIYPGEGSEFYPRYYNGKFALHQRCYAIYDIAPNFATRYLYFFCKTQNSYFVRNAVGSTVASLRLDTFKRLNIPNIPIEVQKTYIQLLDKIETKIVDNKTVLKKYEEQKKYLLSKMFI